jgi:hypothetical protein
MLIEKPKILLHMFKAMTTKKSSVKNLLTY